jgi:hypothetical protein
MSRMSSCRLLLVVICSETDYKGYINLTGTYPPTRFLAGIPTLALRLSGKTWTCNVQAGPDPLWESNEDCYSLLLQAQGRL